MQHRVVWTAVSAMVLLANQASAQFMRFPMPNQPKTMPAAMPPNPYANQTSPTNMNVSNPYVAQPMNRSMGSSSMPYAQGNTMNGYASNGQSKQANSYEAIDLLSAYGIPAEEGKIRWPLAMRMMPPWQGRDRLDQIESALQLATLQSTSGTPPDAVVRNAHRNVQKLQHWLYERRDEMAEQTYRDGARFLRQLEYALRGMRAY